MDRKEFNEWFQLGPYYDMDGKPMDVLDWFNKYRDNKHVAQDTIGDFWISTVLLGMDHNHYCSDNDQKDPIIFETMIFHKAKEGQPEDKEFEYYQERYCTKEEAVEGHWRACETIKDYLEKRKA
jgi:hypothetical protein